MEKRAGHLGHLIKPRGLTEAEAAEYVGLTIRSLRIALREGQYSPPSLPRGRFDRKLLEQEMDRHSGLSNSQPEDALAAWERRRDAR
jgi:hypothetical protein